MELISKIDISDITAFLALIVSVSAIWYNRETFILQRDHSILSIKPLITSVYIRSIEGNISIAIRNNGLGPAILKNIAFSTSTYKGNQIIEILKRPSARRNNEEYKFILENLTIYTPSNNYALSEKDEIILAKSKITEVDIDIIKIIQNCYGKIKIEVEYEDIYSKKYVLSEHIASENN